MLDSKILIVEDEQIIAENLRFILNEYGYKYVDIAIDDKEAIVFFKKTSYDLVLMDVNLGSYSMDGVNLVKHLSKDYSFLFIYVTANTDVKTIVRTKTTRPLSYIVKPFVNTTIYANVEIALHNLNREKYFYHSQKGMQQKTLLSNIIYVKADGAYINLFTLDNEKFFVRKSLVEFNELFQQVFIRIHKSLLVNKNHVNSYSSQVVKVNNLELPLGRAYKQSFMELIN